MLYFILRGCDVVNTTITQQRGHTLELYTYRLLNCSVNPTITWQTGPTLQAVQLTSPPENTESLLSLSSLCADTEIYLSTA